MKINESTALAFARVTIAIAAGLAYFLVGGIGLLCYVAGLIGGVALAGIKVVFSGR